MQSENLISYMETLKTIEKLIDDSLEDFYDKSLILMSNISFSEYEDYRNAMDEIKKNRSTTMQNCTITIEQAVDAFFMKDRSANPNEIEIVKNMYEAVILRMVTVVAEIRETLLEMAEARVNLNPQEINIWEKWVITL